MRKSSFGLAMVIAVILTMVVPAFGADLDTDKFDTTIEYNGDDCKGSDLIAVWHFVANQTEGKMGKLIITLPDNSTVGPLAPDKYNKHFTNQHWWVEGPNVPDQIAEAETLYYDDDTDTYRSLPGKLVISDAYCVKKSDWEPFDSKR